MEAPKTEQAAPQDIKAEQACLGCMLLEPEAIAQALAIVEADDFYYTAHRAIARAVQALHGRGEPVDLVTVADELRKHDALDDVGGASYLAHLIDTVATTAHVSRYAQSVLTKARMRDFIRLSAELGKRSTNGTTPDEVLDWLSKRLLAARKRAKSAHAKPAGDWRTAAWETLELAAQEYKATGGTPRGVLFGMAGKGGLDFALHGVKPPSLVAILAREGWGKTTLILQAIVRSTIQPRRGMPAAIFSLEMPVQHQLFPKLACMTAGIPKAIALRGALKPEQWKRMAAAFEKIRRSPLHLVDSASFTIADIERELRTLHRESQIRVCAIDYIQLISSDLHAARFEQLDDIARRLLALAQELNIVIIVGSQQTAVGDYTQTKGSRGLDEAADIVIQIRRGRKSGLSEDKQYNTHLGYLLVRKDRMGDAAGKRIPYVFDKLRDRYWSVPDLQEAYSRGQPDLPPMEDNDDE